MFPADSGSAEGTAALCYVNLIDANTNRNSGDAFLLRAFPPFDRSRLFAACALKVMPSSRFKVEMTSAPIIFSSHFISLFMRDTRSLPTCKYRRGKKQIFLIVYFRRSESQLGRGMICSARRNEIELNAIFSWFQLKQTHPNSSTCVWDGGEYNRIRIVREERARVARVPTVPDRGWRWWVITIRRDCSVSRPFHLNSLQIIVRREKQRSSHSPFPEPIFDVPTGIIVLLSIFYGSISIIAVVGNSLVIWIVSTTRQMQTVTNLFIANLALADVAIGMFSIPFQVSFDRSAISLGTQKKNFRNPFNGNVSCSRRDSLQCADLSLCGSRLLTKRRRESSDAHQLSLMIKYLSCVQLLSSRIISNRLLFHSSRRPYCSDGTCPTSCARSARLFKRSALMSPYLLWLQSPWIDTAPLLIHYGKVLVMPAGASSS